MSSPIPRRSIDSTASLEPQSPLSQFPFPRYEQSSPRPPSRGRYTRQNSVAGSVTSIAGVLEGGPPIRGSSIVESSPNGRLCSLSGI